MGGGLSLRRRKGANRFVEWTGFPAVDLPISRSRRSQAVPMIYPERRSGTSSLVFS